MKFNIAGISIRSIVGENYSLFIAEICDYSFLKNWLKLLDAAEITRYNNYQFEGDAQKFAARRFIAKTIIAQNFPAIELPFSLHYTASGKPFLDDKSCWFNWSHSRNYIAVAISDKYPVGIDIEYIDPEFDFMPLWKEITGTTAVSPDLQTFYRYWTVREALAKLSGTGLNEDILNYELNCLPPHYNITVSDPDLIIIQKSISDFQICLAANTQIIKANT